MDNNTLQNNLTDVVGMRDFEDNLNGVSPDVETALYNHIKKTRDVIAAKPEIVSSQQNSEQMLQMYDYLLANWHTNRIEAIRVLAGKEQALLSSGYINYDFSDLSISDVSEHSGIFSVLAELYEDEINELDGLFSKIKNGIKKITKKNIEVLKKVVPKLNRVNPLTIAVRNALRGLIAINFLGLASSLAHSQAKTKGLLAKVQKMYKNMGGKEAKLMAAIAKGKSKKALFNKKMQRQIEAGQFKGLEGLGELGDGGITIASMLTAAGAFIAKIWSWIKQAGLKAKEVIKDIKPFVKKPKQEPQQTTQNNEPVQNSDNDTTFSSGKTNDKDGKRYSSNNTDKKNKWKKPLIAVGILTGLFGIGYGVYSINSKKKENPQLSGFALQ